MADSTIQNYCKSPVFTINPDYTGTNTNIACRAFGNLCEFAFSTTTTPTALDNCNKIIGSISGVTAVATTDGAFLSTVNLKVYGLLRIGSNGNVYLYPNSDFTTNSILSGSIAFPIAL